MGNPMDPGKATAMPVKGVQKGMGSGVKMQGTGKPSTPRPTSPTATVSHSSPSSGGMKMKKMSSAPKMGDDGGKMGGMKKGGGGQTSGVAMEVHGFLSHASAENKEGGVCHCATGYDHGMKSCHGVGPVMTSGMEGGSHGSSGKKC